MAGISVSGMGSGLDINGLVSQLMAIEQRPLTLLNQKEAFQQANISAFGQVRSALSALETAVKGLGKSDNFYAKSASSSDTSLATATATSGASTGSYTMKVLQMAQSQSVASSPITNPGLGTGELTIDFGKYAYDAEGNATGFTANGENSSLTIKFDKGGSIEDLRDAINKQGDGKIKANIIDNGSGKQLVLSGTGMGDESAFTVSGTGSLDIFSYDASNTTSSSMQSMQQAQNSKVMFGGLEISRDSNKLENIISGVTVDLVSADPNKSVTIKVVENHSAATGAMESFVKAYNEFASTIASLTSYDEKTKEAGLLLGDSTVRSLQSQMRSLLGESIPGGGDYDTLSKMGISFTKDGMLEFNKGKFETALNKPNSTVGDFFIGKDGFAAKAQSLLTNYLDNTNGILVKRTDSINSTIKNIDKQREAFAVRLDSIEKRYRSQFTSLDLLLSKMNSTSNYLSQQLANLSKIGSS